MKAQKLTFNQKTNIKEVKKKITKSDNLHEYEITLTQIKNKKSQSVRVPEIRFT